jgi:hypothetical protein
MIDPTQQKNIRIEVATAAPFGQLVALCPIPLGK